MHVHDADVRDADLAPLRDDVLAGAQRVLRAPEERVAPALHRRRPGVVGLTVKDDARAPHAHDRLDHADVDPGFLEPWALLDVELDVCGDGARRRLRVRHARGTPIDVRVRVSDDLVRTDVSDGGEGFDPRDPDPSPMKTSGWGLFLVGKMAARWGAEQETGTVWFELAR